MRSTNILGLVVCLWTAGPICAAQSAPANQSPSWSQEIVPDLSRSRPGVAPNILGSGNRAGVGFLDDEQLIVYAVEPTGQLSSRKSPEISSAFRLRVSLLDAKSGKQILTKDWGTRPHDSTVQITSGGVLVKTGAVVRLYSAEFSQSRDLPLALDPNGSYFTSVSASGKTIAISHYFKKDQNWTSHLDVLDASALRIRYSWDRNPPLFHVSMSDESFATIGIGNGIVSLAEFGSAGRSKVVSVVPALKQGCAAGGTWTVTSAESIVLRDCKEVLLLDANGASFSLEAFDGSGSAGAATAQCGIYMPGWNGTAVASGAPLVAVSLPAIRVKKHLLTEPGVCLTGLQVAVYDLSRKRRVLTANVDPLPKNGFDFALSPDGSKLAVLNDRRVSLYSVPAP